jgi:predicted membrane chloride channel (bestrophin family)
LKTIALVLFIVFEVVILVMADYFGQSLGVSIAIALFVLVAIVLFVTSDFFLDSWERWRGRDG